ncbi:hypothetical protein A2930_04010 [Candidatus Giovannonibacteria bacterium RIFCSPLOWO2_01_FULL_45_34]|uniref:Fido domain-containing protein n=1 Tax=Candidatus Giovannonibacteria bacterium RIFCSPLOWO2_01_FULL_45_34 TaxID=1798351 RepID=A0A1F5X1G3_9BACT|nr:MAG: hypothetical protein A2930_04010 [Candidatus Giovannonibacteria bacterium RIFCSPLOWO2_01_FULL_45_34]
MINGLSCDDFAAVFKENIEKRSRTAKGVSDTSTSSKKKKLLKEKTALKEQVAENTECLVKSVAIDSIFYSSIKQPFLKSVTIRALMESWDSVINSGLQEEGAYLDDYLKLCASAKELKKTAGFNYRVNKRYRTWRVSYTKANLDPLQLESAMDFFYGELVSKIELAVNKQISQAELLAYADHMIDGEIHPWADGCGRSATAAVMWLSLLSLDFVFPVFGERSEHYAAIHDLTEHTKYYECCLSGK